MDYLINYKENLFVKKEADLIKLNTCSMSREICLAARTRIMEPAAMERG